MMGASLLPKAREMAVRHAQSIGSTHILFLDDDMGFEGNLLEMLLAADKDIVGVNYMTKSPIASKPTAYTLDNQLITGNDILGVSEVGWIGFGAVLIRLGALVDIPAPLFEVRWLPESNDYLGEDLFFCKKVREHGLKIHLHHDIAMKHIGDYPYGKAA